MKTRRVDFLIDEVPAVDMWHEIESVRARIKREQNYLQKLIDRVMKTVTPEEEAFFAEWNKEISK